MITHELPHGNLMVPLNPKAPGPTGDEALEISPDHPDYERWLPEATREAVYDAWRRVRTIEEVETAERVVDRFEAAIESDRKNNLAADAAMARESLKIARQSIERYGEGPRDG